MGSSLRICQRLGAFGGLAVGFACWGIAASLAEVIVSGVLVALLALGFAGLFLLLIGGYRARAVLMVVVVCCLVEGILLAPLASAMASLFVSMLACGVLGMLIGWVVCLLLCRYASRTFAGRGLR